MENNLKTTLQYLLNAIILPQTEVSVESSESNQITFLTIAIPPESAGQVIGKQGKIIKSLRTLLSIAHPQQKFDLEIKN